MSKSVANSLTEDPSAHGGNCLSWIETRTNLIERRRCAGPDQPHVGDHAPALEAASDVGKGQELLTLHQWVGTYGHWDSAAVLGDYSGTLAFLVH